MNNTDQSSYQPTSSTLPTTDAIGSDPALPPAPQKNARTVTWLVIALVAFVAVTTAAIIWSASTDGAGDVPGNPAGNAAQQDAQAAAEPAEPEFVADEDAYRSAIRTSPVFSELSDDEVIDMGYSSCDMMATQDIAELVARAEDGNPLAGKGLLFVFDAAAHHLCPENLDALNEYRDNN